MPNLSDALNELMGDFGVDSRKLLAVARNKDAYRSAIHDIWKDEEAASLVLEHTNAVYVRDDEHPKVGKVGEGTPKVFEACIDDALIRSEMDTHKELLAVALKRAGLEFDSIRIVPARWGMRDKHPFKGDIA